MAQYTEGCMMDSISGDTLGHEPTSEGPEKPSGNYFITPMQAAQDLVDHSRLDIRVVSIWRNRLPIHSNRCD